MYRITLVSLALLASPVVTAAQTVIGHALNAETRAPLRGVFVVLVDGTGQQHIGVLSDGDGRFIIRAPAPGEYTLRADHIGYRTARVPTFTLKSGESFTVTVPIEVQALQFQAIQVSGTRRCRVRPEAGVETARLWEEVRKALEVAAWMKSGSASYRVVNFRRNFDLKAAVTGEDELRFVTALASKAFDTAPIDSLLTTGFVFENDNRTLFHGPDADLLMSHQFQDMYCFSVARDRDHPGLIGLAFEPRRDRGVVEIEGTLWVDERTGELRSIDYVFTRMRVRGADSQPGGRTEFTRLPSGAWIVKQWTIRMPRYEPRGRYNQTVLVGSTVEGSEILGVEWADDSLAVGLTGAVFDSLSGGPLNGGRVVVLGTYITAEVDSVGGFRVDAIKPGDYYLEIEHPHIDALPKAPEPRRIRVAEAENPAIQLATPSRQSVLNRSCDADDIRGAVRRTGYPRSRLGAVSGSVRDQTTHAPLRATARVSWTAPEPRELEQRAEADGAFTICGVPDDVPLLLEVTLGRQILYRGKIGLLTSGFYRTHLLVEPLQ